MRGSHHVFRHSARSGIVVVPHPKYLVDIGDVDPSVATPYSCSGVTVYSALKKALPIRDDEWLAIMGAGGLGLSAVAIAKAMGVKNVISVDIDDSHLEAARGMGASAVLNPKTAGNAVAELQKLAGGELRAVVDTVGGEATSGLGIAAVLGRVSPGTLFSFVLLGWACQLALRDFAGRELQSELERSFLVTLMIQGRGTPAPEFVYDDLLARALGYHLREHSADYAECSSKTCAAARGLQRRLALSEAELAEFARACAADCETSPVDTNDREDGAAPEALPASAPALPEPNEDAPGGGQPPSASSS